ncbi:GTP cyclohydrolase 1 type 2 [Emticicia aquatica]|jgi:dinuclear metal center YbgI/SA1388 family protein|uniref:GTP cyclohydrolase 1 type 2 homolog n=1 Tax=Emticicia aquatica TaxID=1681835 RepID=A0ABM9APK0_9BACT|nr:Nif3-like dinuclear metal center hexameric protein [Emticicia aquatica]CAH0995751.1 GTP cyclohydrolase 1 type 2 [Emticicia aquatica]
MTIKELTNQLELIAPLSYQESYDNAGLIVGNANQEITGVLICLDSTEAIIDEAIEKGCNLVIAHHPIIFKGLKKLNGKNYIERTIIKAIKHDIAIYATHTNLDNVVGGVNFKIAQMLDLHQVKILSPKNQSLMKLVVFVPVENAKTVLAALHEAGAGIIGNYSHVSFRAEGTGRFRPNEFANPTIGAANIDEEVHENRVEVIFPAYLKNQVLAAMYRTHIYEEVAHDIILLENQNQEVGSGAIGELAEPMNEKDFLHFLKQRMNVSVIRHTQFLDKPIKKVAVCGGAGGFLLNDVIAQGADIFITADYKYHEFFDADNRVIIADIGHYESEQYTKELLKDYICKKIINFAVHLSGTPTNPIKYFY